MNNKVKIQCSLVMPIVVRNLASMDLRETVGWNCVLKDMGLPWPLTQRLITDLLCLEPIAQGEFT